MKAEQYFFTGETAIRLKVSPQTILNWVKKGKLKPSMQIGGKFVYCESELLRFEAKKN